MRIGRRDHPQWKFLRSIAESERERRIAGKTLLDGIHLLEAYRGIPELVIVSASGLENAEVAACLTRAPLVELPDAMFEQLSTVKSPTGVMALIAVSTPFERVTGSCVVLDAVQDTGNVGSILRSSAAAGIRHVVLGKGSARAWSPRVLRAGMGAHFALQIHDGVDLGEALASYRGQVLATEANSPKSLYGTDLTGNVAWLLGNEGAGLGEAARKLSTSSVSIPITANTESLNVAAAAAICLFEQKRQRG
ncbi:MAG: RNA methyltransferase [Clostridia bacterium]|nr:RNA methyltransferase [Deltaproteobacteria bacterium]